MPSPARHLSGAAELLRTFNHDSRVTKADWEFPGATYSALGALTSLIGKLPQAIEQSARPVKHTHKHGRLLIDGGGDADQSMEHLRKSLETAVNAAELLHRAVAHVHAATRAMALDTRGLPTFQHEDLDR